MATLRYTRWDPIFQDSKSLDCIIQRKDLYQCAIIDSLVITLSSEAVFIKLQLEDLLDCRNLLMRELNRERSSISMI